MEKPIGSFKFQEALKIIKECLSSVEGLGWEQYNELTAYLDEVYEGNLKCASYEALLRLDCLFDKSKDGKTGKQVVDYVKLKTKNQIHKWKEKETNEDK
tara:strand:- start:314 stop:610 length:297 start_codon:yes stop_codon:yes gene_type:complete